jgi:rare lipoprotein A
MSSNSCVRNSPFVTEGIFPGAPFRASAGFRNLVRLFALTLTAAALAACAQSSAVTDKHELRAASPEASLEDNRTRVAAKQRKQTPFATDGNAAKAQFAPYGVASFYSDEQQTANGENFNPSALTAAHPTLPFGTRLRVTNLATGRSVTVRVNDRGPFVPGRIVDVSYSAAETLGIVERGVAKVKLDVVQ